MLEVVREIAVDLNLNNPLSSSYTVIKDVDPYLGGIQAYTYEYDNAKITVKLLANLQRLDEYELAYDVDPLDPNNPAFTVPWDSEVIFKLVVAAIDYLQHRDAVVCIYYNTPSQSRHNAYQYYAGLWGMIIDNRMEITET
jgi:hypothetical protein